MSVDELWKYEKAYALDSYHLQGARLAVARADIEAMPAGAKYLDVGCGRGETVKMALALSIAATGVEMVGALCNPRKNIYQMDIETLTFATGFFDFVTCYDVLEHLTPGTEQRALDELGRVCGGVLILTTNNKPSFLPTGEDLHINKRARDEWHRDITRRWGVPYCGNINATVFGNDEWKWRIDVAEKRTDLAGVA